MAHKGCKPTIIRSNSKNVSFDSSEGEIKERKHQLSRMLKLAVEPENKKNSTVLISDDANKIAIQTIQNLIKIRSMRGRYFPEDLFADAAWDILLDLTSSMAADRRISVSSLCIAANVPMTTALRKIKAMIDDGLLIMITDVRDGRRKYVRLSESAYASMLEFAIAVS